MKKHVDFIAQIMQKCIHFRGIQNECGAKTDIRQLVAGDAFGWATRIPCFADNETTVTCASRQLPSREESQKIFADYHDSMARSLAATSAAHGDAKKKGLRKGNGGVSEMPCPLECGGTLRYSVASCNGHMHAACTTPTCVRWME